MTPTDPIPHLPEDSIQEPLSDNPSPSKGLIKATDPNTQADGKDELRAILERLFEAGKVSIGLMAPRKFTTTITVDEAYAAITAEVRKAEDALLDRMEKANDCQEDLAQFVVNQFIEAERNGRENDV